MSALVRAAVGLVLLGALAGGVLWVARGETGAAAPPSWQSSAQCKSCHQDVWDEWHGSHHQIAYLNPEVRRLSDDFRNKECQACHLPRPISVTGFGQRTLPRLTHPDEGVSCLTCHLGANGEILGRNARPQAGCAPVASPELVSVEQCQSCHNQHTTTDQWRASEFAAKGVSCNDCHMPEVERRGAGGARKGRSHVYPGAHDKDMLLRAGTFEAKREGGELVLALTNTGAGHNFPTEERHRAVDIDYRFLREGEAGGEWQRGYRFRQPYRDEPGPDTQLPAGKRHEVRIPIPEGAARAEARLWYRLTPFATDDDPKSTLLAEQRVELR